MGHILKKFKPTEKYRSSNKSLYTGYYNVYSEQIIWKY